MCKEVVKRLDKGRNKCYSYVVELNKRKQTPMAFSIYIADLAEYNAGRLTGEWVDVDNHENVESLQEVIDTLLAKNNNEEWAIHDYDYSDCPDLKLGEDESLKTLIELNQLLNEHGEAFADFHLWDNSIDVDRFNDSYCGQFESLEDYATELFDELHIHDVPKHIQNYIDYDAFARDLRCEGYFITENGHVFRPV